MKKRLRDWFARNRRDLPWRRTRDPWAIWVSEVMLQQTRVEAVRELYPRFMSRYPDPASLAAANDDELLAAWRGLGYYRRARFLRDGAQAVMERHGGVVPKDPQALSDLPGIGPYTRGAVASIAFDLRELAIDGNVERVVARHQGIHDLPRSATGARKIRAVVQTWQDPDSPGDFNQALMELGATICTPKAPRCLLCPLASDCHARTHNLQDQLPTRPTRRDVVDVHAQAAVLDAGKGRLLGYRVANSEINAGQVDLPGPGILTSLDSEDLPDALATCFGIRCHIQGEAATIRHGITHHRIRLTAHWGTFEGTIKRPLLRVAPGDPRVPWTTAARKVFVKIGLSAANS